MKNIMTVIVLLAIVATTMSTATAAEVTPMITVGKDGKLSYATDERGNSIPDFSRVGYMGGGVKLPDVPVKKELSPAKGGGDDTARIQQALDELGKVEPDESGFRGALLLKRGTYRVEGELRLKSSGVVLRGEGQGEDGTILLATGTKQRTLIKVGSWGNIKEVEGSRRKITDAYVPWGTMSFNVDSTNGLSVGDEIILCRPGTQQWLHDIGVEKLGKKVDGKLTGNWTPEGYTFRFERVITAIQGKRITLDAPVVNAMEDKYGGGYVYRYEDKGRITQVGVEQLRVVSEYKSTNKKNEEDEEHCNSGVQLTYVVNGWVRNVTGVHLIWAAVFPSDGSKFITVQDCAYLEGVSKYVGGRRYPFPIAGQLCLVQRCFSETGRHCNVARARSCGPNVYLDCSNHHGDSGPHERWAMGCLYDSLRTPALVSHYRGNMGTGHGWIGAQIVFWNCDAGGMNLERPPTAEIYAIGCKAKGNTGKAHFELQGTNVSPRSLYLKQLEDRLGKKAVENITTEAQRSGTIYDLLKKEFGQ